MATPTIKGDRSRPIFVTGGTGMVGGAVVELLAAAGRPVRALVRPTSDTRRIVALGAEIIEGNLHDSAGLERACSGCSTVVHTAARVELISPPRAFRHDNAEGTRILADAAAKVGVERFVHVSSVAVHGTAESHGETITETTPLPPLPRFAGYAVSKRLAERAVRAAAARSDMAYVVLRLGFVYGPGNRMMHSLLRPLMAKRTFVMPEGGRRKVAPIYVDDAASAIVTAVDHPAGRNETFLLVGPDQVTQRSFFSGYAEGFGLAAPTGSVPTMVAFLAGWFVEGLGLIQGRRLPINRAMVSTCLLPEDFRGDKIQDRLGWSAKVSVEEGLRRTFSWYHQTYGNPGVVKKTW